MGGPFYEVMQYLTSLTYSVSAVTSHVNRITIMTQKHLLVVSSLWVQCIRQNIYNLSSISRTSASDPFNNTVHCRGATQHPEISCSVYCSHNKDVGHSEMHWYRQRPGSTMTLTVFTAYGLDPDYGGDHGKYLAIKDTAQSGALT